MEIQINTYPAEIELEEERTVQEVVDSINSWIAERKLICVGIEIDENLYQLEEIPEMSLDNVKVINCLVESRADVVYDSLNEAMLYCDRIYDFLVGSEKQGMEVAEIENMLSGMEWLQEIFFTVSSLLNINLKEMQFRDHDVAYYVDCLNEQKQRVIEFLADFKDDDLLDLDEDLFSLIKEIFSILLVSEEMNSLIVESIDSPDVLIQSLKNIREEFISQSNVLEQAAVAYQTGKDNDGVEKLFKFIDFMFSYMRTCYQIAPVFNLDLSKIIIDDISLNEKNMELHDLMNDTLESIENNDMISLADILEYEIRESIEDLDKYIDELFKLVVK